MSRWPLVGLAAELVVTALHAGVFGLLSATLCRRTGAAPRWRLGVLVSILIACAASCGLAFAGDSASARPGTFAPA